MKKTAAIFLLLSFSLSAMETSIFFGLGPGFNSSALNEWIGSSQMGSNMGLNLKFSRINARFAFNPETSGGSSDIVNSPELTELPVNINGTDWPAGMQVNYMGLQYLIGYSVIDNVKYELVPYIGITQNWLSAPYRFEESYNGQNKPDDITYKTDISVGPLFTISNRIHLSRNDILIIDPYFDLGFVFTNFSNQIDPDLEGNHFFFKIGILAGLKLKPSQHKKIR